MFVRQSTYDQLHRRLRLLDLEFSTLRLKLIASEREHNKLLVKWNKLVNRINRLGGEEFLDDAEVGCRGNTQFTKEELRVLIFLCHPDKHGGSKSASNITAKLISLRK